MTEVASLMPANHRLATVRHYEAGPPEGLGMVEPGETFATTKEEEWVSKKKTEVTNTKQIETRVKRQVVLEDGKVVEDSGPMVTTNTTEDSETQEHHQTELRKLGNDGTGNNPAPQEAIENGSPGGTKKDLTPTVGSQWVSVPNPDGVVREVKEKRVISREETEEVKETEDVQHYGDITDEDFISAVSTGRPDIRQVLRTRKDSQNRDVVVSTGPRVIRDTSKSNKVTDSEDKRELSSVQPDGKIVTETQRTTEHEEINDDELPETASDQNLYKETSQRYLKTRDQEDVDYVADGRKIGHEMRHKTETMEVERHGDGVDEPDFDSLSARVRKRNSRQPHRYRGLENNETSSPLDRKDAVTRKPLDFDQEEETRKVETSKWLEHHFGSESRSSNNSIIDDDGVVVAEEKPPKTSFFNVTIKSQPTRSPTPPQNNHNRSFVTTVNNSSTQNSASRVYARSPVNIEPERERVGSSINHNQQQSEYFKGISQWSERRHHHHHQGRISPPERPSPTPPIIERYQQKSPIPDYIRDKSPPRDYIREISPPRNITPTPPQRKRATEKPPREKRYHQVEERRYNTASRQTRSGRNTPMEEPPPDYSPPNPPAAPPPPAEPAKRASQKTRFAPEPPKQKSGNIIGQSIRKLVGKIRSASAERKANKQRNKRSPSPSYKKGHVIDGNIVNHPHSYHGGMDGRPVQRYYLGEDPFAGSIYGRENKYDGVKPARSSRKIRDEEHRSQSTLGRFSKSTSRLLNTSPRSDERGAHYSSSQTLPRHLNRHEPPTRLDKSPKSSSTINVSIVNTLAPSSRSGPAKPARTYKSNLARSKSLNVHANQDYRRPGMYTSNPQLNRLDETPVGLKSPGLISSLSRSQKDLHHNHISSTSSRFAPNIKNSNINISDGHSRNMFMTGLKDRAPELFKTLQENDTDDSKYRSAGFRSSTPIKTAANHYNGDIYEPPTRLTSSPINNLPVANLRRGSNSSTDFSETYHTTTRNGDPHRPSVTNTVTTLSKKTIPTRNGRGLETIESSEVKSVTKSSFRGGNESGNSVKFYDTERRYNAGSPVVIEVRNTNFRK